VRSISHVGSVVLVLAGLLLGAGCSSGSDDSTASANPASNTANPNESGSNSNDGSNGDGNGDASNGSDEPHDLEVPAVENGNWTGGTLHMEVTGDAEATFDAPGSGSTLDGVTSAAFTEAPNTVSIGLGGDTESAISLTAGGVSTVGGFRTNCTIDFTKSEASSLAADFACDDLDAVGTGTTDIKTIDVTGNFTLTR
jgi:hypothetical protein